MPGCAAKLCVMGTTTTPGRPTTVDRLLPGWSVLRRYDRRWLWPDVIGGLTVGAMLVPQSMGYAELAGMPPQHGFYAVIGALVVYALVGTSRHLGVGPEPGTAVLAATAVAGVASGDAARYIALMAALALLVGGVCLAAALLRLGHLASMLSRPVLVGYIAGVGLTLLSSQIAGSTGVRITTDSFFPRCWEFVRHLDEVHTTTLLVSGASLALILGLRRWAPTVPAALVAVGGATIVVAAFGLDDRGVALVGAIPAGLPVPGLPDITFDDAIALLPAAAAIALVGFTDNVLTARAIAAKQGDRIDANQELIALGAINLTAGLSRGFPISSSASRTVVPATLGSRTQLVSLIGSAFVVVTLLALRPVLGHIPRGALAAVIIAAAIAIIDVAAFRSLWRLSRTEFGLAVVATLGVVVLGVLAGILLAVGLSVAVALQRMAKPHDAVLGDLPGLDGWVDTDEFPAATVIDGLLVFRFDAPLFFLNIDRFGDRLEEAIRESPGDEEWVVIDCEGIGSIDVSAVDGLRDLVERVTAGPTTLIAVARANDHVIARLQRAELLAPHGPIVEFPTINGAVRAFRDR
jgi:high affinity sulfate transporter 1